MLDYLQSGEKRKEPRFALQMPARVELDVLQKVREFPASIEDISLHGIRSSMQAYLKPGQRVWVSFTSPLLAESSHLQGNVVWSKNGNGKFILGIHLLHKHSFLLNLEQASSYLKPSKDYQNTPQGNATRPELIPPCFFHIELYWGLWFKTFREILQNKLVQLSSSLLLSSACVGNFLLEYPKEALPKQALEQLQKNLLKLNITGQGFLPFIKLLRIMQAENITAARAIQENMPKLIQMDNHLQKRLQALQNKLESLGAPCSGVFFSSLKQTSLFCAPAWRVDQGLDILLLYTYRHLLFGNANRINIQLYEKDGIICLEFLHNGSAILKNSAKELQLSPQDWMEHSMQASKDLEELLWLFYVLHLFQDLDPKILLYNESGNNMISLRIHPGC